MVKESALVIMASNYWNGSVKNSSMLVIFMKVMHYLVAEVSFVAAFYCNISH